MLLDVRLEAELDVLGERNNEFGRVYWECRLASDDGQLLHLYEGQLKELPEGTLAPGRRYRVWLRPFVNNRWLELKVDRVEPIGPGRPPRGGAGG